MRRQDGIVIIAVLWICALIMWFALQIGSETRLRSEEQVHAILRSQSLHLAIGGCYEALARIGKNPDINLPGGLKSKFQAATRKGAVMEDDQDWLPDGATHLLQYTTGQALVLVEDENEKVNVNIATPEQLKPVLEKAGLEAGAAEHAADVIADFIDKDDFVRQNGAEKAQYANTDLWWGPFNGPLLSLDQMLLIKGMSQRLFYGFGRTDADNDQKQQEAPRNPVFPSRYSLFEMLTTYGKNTQLQERFADELKEKVISWQSGGVYRILSCGMSRGGPPPVLIWLTVRNSPQAELGYQVLYRKIL